jgi:cell wall-associated NlpC family hydrolase
LGCGLAGTGFLLGLVVLAAGVGGPVASSAVTESILAAVAESMCQSAGPLSGLSPAQSANAEVIVSVSDTLSGENPQAAQIALMTALTESALVNDPGGMGGALGLFQQTPPGWGTAGQILDPAYAAGAFIQRLLAVPDWQRLPPWQGAQDVQHSGAGQPGSPLNPTPGTSGGNYEPNWVPAQRVYAQVTGANTAEGCGAGPPGGEAGPPSAHGLPAGYQIPAGTSTAASKAVDYALSKLGDAYVWGASGPDQFDCSGLTMMAWAQGGISLAHYTVTQEHQGRQLAPSQIAPGDLVLIPGSDPPGPGLPGHVGLYLGDGLVISAIDAQEGVAVQTWSTFVSGGLDAVVDPTQPPG